jgi:hypothetical protein
MPTARSKRTKDRFAWYEFFAGGGMARLGLGDRWNCIFANEWSGKKAKRIGRTSAPTELKARMSPA